MALTQRSPRCLGQNLIFNGAAAIEGHWETNHQEPMPLLLFAIPDMQQEKNHFELGVPYLGSLILTHEMNGAVTGLKDFPHDERPNALLVFWELPCHGAC